MRRVVPRRAAPRRAASAGAVVRRSWVARGAAWAALLAAGWGGRFGRHTVVTHSQVLYRFTSDLDGYLSPALPLAEAGMAAPADSPLSLMWTSPVDHADLGCELSLHRGRLVPARPRANPALACFLRRLCRIARSDASA